MLHVYVCLHLSPKMAQFVGQYSSTMVGIWICPYPNHLPKAQAKDDPTSGSVAQEERKDYDVLFEGERVSANVSANV